MGAGFLNLPLMHDNDLVSMLDRGKSVCYDKGCSAFHHGLESLLYLHLRTRINGRCRLIQDQHRRQCQHQASNTKKLLFSLRKTAVIALDISIIPIWQTFDKFMRMGSSGCLHHLFFCRIRVGKQKVFPDSALFQPGLL